jgi:hypothetical protein
MLERERGPQSEDLSEDLSGETAVERTLLITIYG